MTNSRRRSACSISWNSPLHSVRYGALTSGSTRPCASATVPARSRPLRPAQRDVEGLLPLDHLAERLAAHGRLDDVVDVGHADVPGGALVAVDGEFQAGLAADAVQPRVEHAGHLGQGVLDLVAEA